MEAQEADARLRVRVRVRPRRRVPDCELSRHWDLEDPESVPGTERNDNDNDKGLEPIDVHCENSEFGNSASHNSKFGVVHRNTNAVEDRVTGTGLEG